MTQRVFILSRELAATLIILGFPMTVSEGARTSKACFGTQNIPCTMHTLECSSGMIAIQDAYYTNSTNCTSVGLPSCNINISSIPDTGRYRDFNETQLNTLYRDCFNKTRCTFNGVRQSVITFSIVKFICTNVPTTTEYISTVKSTTVTETVKTSKACYGTEGLPCTKHTLECSSGMIAIEEAYYTNSTACGVAGLSGCNINVSSIQDTGRYLDLNETQLKNLYKNCSNQQSCTFNVFRRSVITFSIVKYICINGDTSVSGQTTPPESVSTESVSPESVSPESVSPKSVSYEFPGIIYVAGIFTGFGVLLLSGILIYFLIIRRRFDLTKKQDAVPASVTHPTYDGLTELQQTNNYDVINRESNSETPHPSLYENVAKSP